MRKKFIYRILLSTIIILFFTLGIKSNCVFGINTHSTVNGINKSVTKSFYAPFNAAYLMSGDWVAYCRSHGKALGGTVGGKPFTKLLYSFRTNASARGTLIEPMTGYAYNCGYRGAILQNTIWYSKTFTGGGDTDSVVDSDTGIGSAPPTNVLNYGYAYYGIMQPYMDLNAGKNYKTTQTSNSNNYYEDLFQITSDTTEKNVNVLVDQINKKYIVGPYKIQINDAIKQYSVAYGGGTGSSAGSYDGGGNFKGHVLWPVISKNITSRFGPRKAPLPGASTYHKGLDIGRATAGGKSLEGEPIHAIANGLIISMTSSGNAGKCVRIDHGIDTNTGKRIISVYMHGKQFGNFHVGDEVKMGDVILYAGNTGNSTGAHLHFQIEENGTPVNPELYYPNGKPTEVSQVDRTETKKEDNSNQEELEDGEVRDDPHNDDDNTYSNVVIENALLNDGGKALYDELCNWRNRSNPFATFDIAKDLKGITGDPNTYKFLDENGNEIAFPDFVNEKPFYIEYTPLNDGDTEYVGAPEIDIHWSTSYNYTVDGSWRVQDIMITGLPTDYKVKDNRLTAIGIGGPTRRYSLATTTRNYVQNYNDDYTDDPEKFYAVAEIQMRVNVGKSRIYTETVSKYGLFVLKDSYVFHKGPRWINQGNKSDYAPMKGDYYYIKNTNVYRMPGAWELVNISDNKFNYKWNKRDKLNDLASTDDNKIVWLANISDKTADKIQPLDGQIKGGGVTLGTAQSILKLNKSINLQIGGTVWTEENEIKTANIDGNGDNPFAGIQVQLYDLSQNVGLNSGTLVATTTTNQNGYYRFYGRLSETSGKYIDIDYTQKDMYKLVLNPLHKYYVTFIYNGQVYQNSLYEKSLASPGGKSNAKDIDREPFNKIFTFISDDDENYKVANPTLHSGRAYGLNHKIGNETFKAKLNEFNQKATIQNNINKDVDLKNDDGTKLYGTRKNDVLTWEAEINNYQDESNIPMQSKSNNIIVQDGTKLYGGALDQDGSIATFIKDSMIPATTYQSNKSYPKDTNILETYCINDIEAPIDDVSNNANTGITLGSRSFQYVYRKGYDQARYVDFVMASRPESDLALVKDVFRLTMLVNGKMETFDYNKKDLDKDGVWEVDARKTDPLFNGKEFYSRPIRKSDYLYYANDNYPGQTNTDISKKNLQIWVTYKIVVKNQGDTNVDLNQTEIVDYYDSDQYEFDGKNQGGTYELTTYTYHDYSLANINNNSNNTNNTNSPPYDSNNSYKYINTYNGADGKGKRLYDKDWTSTDLVVTENSTLSLNSKRETIINKNSNYNYDTIYFTGLRNSNGGTTLHRGELSYSYITFKVRTDNATKRVKIDQTVIENNGSIAKTTEIQTGKRNIAEINTYATYYVKDQEVPNYAPGDVGGMIGVGTGKDSNEIKGMENVDPNDAKTRAGIVDIDSNPGSLSENDLTDTGDLKEATREDDTDKAPNIKVIFEDDEYIRKLKGMAYEDNRDIESNKSKVGNGKYDDGETKIDGVTVQLVELVQDIDQYGFSNGEYLGEKIWSSYTYNDFKFNATSLTRNYERYCTGLDKSKVILSGPKDTIFGIEPDTLTENEGEYEFESLPAGDFYIRFVYGDTIDTTLIKNSIDKDGQVIQANEVNELLTLQGKNEKSYNGQDYKSTVYQSVLEDDKNDSTKVNKKIEIKQEANQGFNFTEKNKSGVTEFTDYDRQNYALFDDVDYVDVNSLNSQDVSNLETTMNVKMVVDSKEKDVSYIPNEDVDQSNNTGYLLDKSMMYYYNITKTDELSKTDGGSKISDAKDVYEYRQRGIIYASNNQVDQTGKDSTSANQNNQNYLPKTSLLTKDNDRGVLNNKAEILTSFEKLGTYEASLVAESKKNTNNEKIIQAKYNQAKMLANFMNNTKMVSQTGIINIEIDRNKQKTTNSEEELTRNPKENNYWWNPQQYQIDGIDLGLVERPRAQLQINKENENFKVILANGQILFDTNKSVKDLTYMLHEGHSINEVNNLSNDLEKGNKYTKEKDNYSEKNINIDHTKYRLVTAEASKNNTKNKPELLQLYMDDELLEGATMDSLYRITVTNVGEVDYLDNQFYYSGITNNPNQNNMSRTNAVNVVDYVANNIVFYKDRNKQWEVTSAKELTNSSSIGNDGIVKIDNPNNISNDFVNRHYFDKLSTYNTLIHTTTKNNEDGKIDYGLRVDDSSTNGNINDIYPQGLLPEMVKSSEEIISSYNKATDQSSNNSSVLSSASTTLDLSVLLSANTSGDNLIYNNLTEIIATTNTQGRRMQFSVVGNQEMSDQKLGNNASTELITSDDLVTPTEIDADSAQKIVIMPPTGANRNYIPFIIVSVIGILTIIGATILLKEYIIK